MPFALTDDDCEIYYEVHGDGPAIVLVPGFMGITAIWSPAIAALSDRYRCIALDTRGAGRSDKPLPRVAYGVDRHAADLHAVLEAAGVSRAVLVGHSMGGNIACRYQRAHPERVAGIVFVGSYVSGAQIVGAGNTPARIRDAVTRKADRIAFYCAVGIPESMAIESAKWPLYAVLGNAESFLAFDGADDMPAIDVPCLVVHGDGDIVSPFDPCATGLADALPDAEVVMLDGVNHCPMLEASDRTNAAVETYLARIGY